MTGIDLNAYRQLFDAMPIAALMIDDQGSCLDANRAATEFLGEEILEPGWNAFESDNLRGEELTYLIDTLRQQDDVPGHDATLYGPGGTRLVHISGHRVFNDALDRNVTWMLLGDVTDTSADAYRISLMNRQLEESNQKLDQFALMAAHDLKAPARRVRMFAQLLGADADLSEASKGFVDRIHISGSQMEDIIDGLLEFARIGRDDVLQPVELRLAIQGACARLASEIDEAGYHVTLTGDFPVVMASKVAIGQLFHNLVSNAIKFRNPDTAGYLQISCVTESSRHGEYVLTFADNGVGFPDEEGDRLFEMLYRAHGKSAFDGNGIGLAICRRVCRTHGWTITAASPLDDGAVFRIAIPKPDPDDYHRIQLS